MLSALAQMQEVDNRPLGSRAGSVAQRKHLYHEKEPLGTKNGSGRVCQPCMELSVWPRA